MLFQLYVLTDSQGEIRYVGQTTKTLSKRLQQHLKPSELAKLTHKSKWIKSLLVKNDQPEIFLLQTAFNKVELDAMERYYIKFFRDEGYRLTNATDGGEGTLGCKASRKTKAKMSVAHKGKILSAEHKAKIAAVNTGKLSEERRSTCSSRFFGVCWSKQNSRWIARINVNGNRKYLGCFKSEVEANEAYQKALKGN